MSASRLKPSLRAAASHSSRIRRPRPRLVQSARTNIARTRAGSLEGSRSRAPPSESLVPVKRRSRLLQPPHATGSPSCSSTKYVPSASSIGSITAMYRTALSASRAP
jgi:hypothetical protein